MILIYDEIEYLKRVYKYISKKIIESENNYPYSENTIYKFLLRTFKNEGRKYLFKKQHKNSILIILQLGNF